MALAQDSAGSDQARSGRVRQAIERAKADGLKDATLIPISALSTGVTDVDAAMANGSIVIVRLIAKITTYDQPDNLMTWYKAKITEVLWKQTTISTDAVPNVPTLFRQLGPSEILLPSFWESKLRILTGIVGDEKLAQVRHDAENALDDLGSLVTTARVRRLDSLAAPSPHGIALAPLKVWLTPRNFIMSVLQVSRSRRAIGSLPRCFYWLSCAWAGVIIAVLTATAIRDKDIGDFTALREGLSLDSSQYYFGTKAMDRPSVQKLPGLEPLGPPPLVVPPQINGSPVIGTTPFSSGMAQLYRTLQRYMITPKMLAMRSTSRMRKKDVETGYEVNVLTVFYACAETTTSSLICTAIFLRRRECVGTIRCARFEA